MKLSTLTFRWATPSTLPYMPRRLTKSAKTKHHADKRTSSWCSKTWRPCWSLKPSATNCLRFTQPPVLQKLFQDCCREWPSPLVSESLERLIVCHLRRTGWLKKSSFPFTEHFNRKTMAIIGSSVSGRSVDLFRVYSIETLFFHIRNASAALADGENIFPVLSLAYEEIKKDRFDRAPGIACEVGFQNIGQNGCNCFQLLFISLNSIFIHSTTQRWKNPLSTVAVPLWYAGPTLSATSVASIWASKCCRKYTVRSIRT